MALRNTGATDQNVTFVYSDGSEKAFFFPAGAADITRNVPLLGLYVDGGTVLGYIAEEPEFKDPHYLGGVISNPVTVSGTVTTDIGTTNPNPLALESGGNLASIAANIAAIKAQTDKLTFHATALFTTTT